MVIRKDRKRFCFILALIFLSISFDGVISPARARTDGVSLAYQLMQQNIRKQVFKDFYVDKPNGENVAISVRRMPKEIDISHSRLLIYRYEMSGTSNFTWIYVSSRVLSIPLKAWIAIKRTFNVLNVGVMTLAEREEKFREAPYPRSLGEQQGIDQLKSDLEKHWVVVISYENPPPEVHVSH